MAEPKKAKKAGNRIDYSTASEEMTCYACPQPIKKHERYFRGLVNLCEPCAEKIMKGREKKEKENV